MVRLKGSGIFSCSLGTTAGFHCQLKPVLFRHDNYPICATEGSASLRTRCRSFNSAESQSREPVSGFGYLPIVFDTFESTAMARSISTGVFTFHEPGFEGVSSAMKRLNEQLHATGTWRTRSSASSTECCAKIITRAFARG